jgi:hypothetical protein
MQVGVITNWNQQSGTITDAAGVMHSADYRDGQTLYSSATQLVPKFSGHHAQRPGHALKIPRRGDPVVFDLDEVTGRVISWGYLQHYVDLLADRFGTEFVAA